MKARVQSLHLLDDERLVAVWRRSAFDEEYRDVLQKIAPLEDSDDDESKKKKLQPRRPVAKDWLIYWLRRDRQSDLGQLEIRGNDYYFWANWLETNRGLVPVLDPDVFGAPRDWRLKIELGEEEKGKVFVIPEPSSSNSFFIYRLDEAMVAHILLFFDQIENQPRLVKTELRSEEAPQWLREKIAAIMEEHSPQAALRRMEGLKNRLRKLLKRS